MNPSLFISHGAPNIIFSDLKSKKSIQNLKKILNIPKSHLQIAINNPQFKLNQIQKKPFEIV